MVIGQILLVNTFPYATEDYFRLERDAFPQGLGQGAGCDTNLEEFSKESTCYVGETPKDPLDGVRADSYIQTSTHPFLLAGACKQHKSDDRRYRTPATTRPQQDVCRAVTYGSRYSVPQPPIPHG